MTFLALAAPAAADPIANARRAYDTCVLTSGLAQIAQAGPMADANLIAETAFQACMTEERAIRLLMSTVNIDPRQLEAVLVRVKLDLKAQLRKTINQ